MVLPFFQIIVSDSISSLVPGQCEHHTRMHIGSGIIFQNVKIWKKKNVKYVLSHFRSHSVPGGCRCSPAHKNRSPSSTFIWSIIDLYLIHHQLEQQSHIAESCMRRFSSKNEILRSTSSLWRKFWRAGGRLGASCAAARYYFCPFLSSRSFQGVIMAFVDTRETK